MEVNLKKLEEIFRKASFNYRLDGVRLTFQPDTVFSNMISKDGDYQVLINMPNEVLKNGNEKVELDFALHKIPRKLLREEDGLHHAEINENILNIYLDDHSVQGLALCPGYLDDLISDNGLPDADDVCCFTEAITSENIREIKSRSRGKSTKIYITRSNDTVDFGVGIASEISSVFQTKIGRKHAEDLVVSFSGTNTLFRYSKPGVTGGKPCPSCPTLAYWFDKISWTDQGSEHLGAIYSSNGQGEALCN